MRIQESPRFPFTLSGCVVGGNKQGRLMGMPTANLDCNSCPILPPLGVYASLVYIEGEEKEPGNCTQQVEEPTCRACGNGPFLGVTNIGTRPTVDNDSRVSIETHLLDFKGNLYGTTLRLELQAFLRPVCCFTSRQALVEQINKDKAEARRLLKEAVSAPCRVTGLPCNDEPSVSPSANTKASELHNCCDLHAHSNASDGSLSPTQLVELACARGLGALALTDHNTTAGLAEFARAAHAHRLPHSCGVEFSVEHYGIELHLLGHFLPEKSWEAINAHNGTFREAKRQNNLDTISRLRRDGYPISAAQLEECFPGAVHNRSHLARLLLAASCVQSIDEAFDGLLKPGAGYFEEIRKPSFLSTVKNIVNWGGVPVWAHPLESLYRARTTPEALLQKALRNESSVSVEACARFISTADASTGLAEPESPDTHFALYLRLVEQFAREGQMAGLIGMETHYVSYTPEEQQAMSALAHRLGLKESGGSDFHGEGKPHISLGTGYGSLRVPLQLFEDLLPVKKQGNSLH